MTAGQQGLLESSRQARRVVVGEAEDEAQALAVRLLA
jgi:hypothetical protein